jgi:hypothetical protein
LSYSFTFNKPIASINRDSVYVRYDTALVIPLKFKSMKLDTIYNRIRVEELIPFDSLPQAPKITFAKGYLISIEKDTSAQFTMDMRLVNAQTTGILSLDIQTNEPHFVIQILTMANKVVRSIADQKKITLNYLNPESYKIRAVIDKNGNGVWDTANYPQNLNSLYNMWTNVEKPTEV